MGEWKYDRKYCFEIMYTPNVVGNRGRGRPQSEGIADGERVESERECYWGTVWWLMG